MTKNKGLLAGIALLSALTITAILLVRIIAGEGRSLISEFISISTGYELIIAGDIVIDFFLILNSHWKTYDYEIKAPLSSLLPHPKLL